MHGLRAPLTRQHAPRPAAAPRTRPALTRREREVGQLLGQRLSDREISEHLVISIRTAEHHVGQVLAKLGVANRREAGTLMRLRLAANNALSPQLRMPDSIPRSSSHGASARSGD